MSENVGFTGQIGPEHLVQVVEKGFKSVINNRPDMEGGPEQPPALKLKKQHVLQGSIMSINLSLQGKSQKWMYALLPIISMSYQNLF